MSDEALCVAAPITSPGGSWLSSGGEEIAMQEGELWWFDNKAMHHSRNDSEKWRTHLIFDLLPAG